MATDNDFSVPSPSRRSFLSLSAATSAALAMRIITEPMLAHARLHSVPKDAVRIDANENPLGPKMCIRDRCGDPSTRFITGRVGDASGTRRVNCFPP